jgi:hypothetical protein
MRKQYHVVPRRGGWAVKGARARRAVTCHGTKSLAVRAARSLARGQKPSQVVIHGKNGAIQREWTYGNDPFPPRG